MTLRAEQDELDAKLDALKDFIDSPEFEEQSEAEQYRLYQQHNAMRAYSDALGARIEGSDTYEIPDVVDLAEAALIPEEAFYAQIGPLAIGREVYEFEQRGKQNPISAYGLESPNGDKYLVTVKIETDAEVMASVTH